MIIDVPEIFFSEDEVGYKVKVSSTFGEKWLWYSVDKKYENMLCISADAALLGMLMPAMCFGEDIYLKGRVSKKLLDNLSGTYQDQLLGINASLNRIRIIADDVTENRYDGKGVATGFSAGVDSYSVLMDSVQKKSDYEITHLIYNNVGSHGKAGERLFNQRYELIKSVPENMGLPFIKINSNLDEFYSGERALKFINTHAPRNASAVLALQGGIGKYVYASTYKLGSFFDSKLSEISKIEHTSFHLTSTETLISTTDGGKYSRVEKTSNIADFEPTYSIFDVCVHEASEENCSSCRKCMRTMLTLDIAGALHKYKKIFNLDKFHKRKDLYIAKTIRDGETFSQEVALFAKEKNYTFPWTSSSLSYFYGCVMSLRRFVRKKR